MRRGMPRPRVRSSSSSPPARAHALPRCSCTTWSACAPPTDPTRTAGGLKTTRRRRVNPIDRFTVPDDARSMTGLAVILLIIGVVLLLLGLFVEAAKFLLWIGIVLVVVAIIAWLFRYIRRGT